MITWEAKVLYKARLLLGEGAYWHTAWKKFLFVDIKGKQIGAIDPQTCAIAVRKLDRMIGMVTAKTGSKLIVALQGSIEEFDFESGQLNKLITIEPGKQENRCNDGACDGMGRLWIGTMHTNGLLHEGALYCFDGGLKKVIPGASVSNGICWTMDHKTMYYIDSLAYNVTAYDFDLATSSITNKHVVIEIADDKAHLPDGMCIDEQGMLWVAIWGAGCINRYNPSNGQLIGKVTVTAPNVTSCAFGGKDMRQLFITTATAGLTKEKLQEFPDSGALFIANVGVRGVIPNTYAF